MANWEVRLYGRRIIQKLAEYPEKVREALESQWPEITAVMISDVLSRTPSIDEEYEALMGVGTADKPVDPPPLDGDESGESDKPRTRFRRTPGLWLQELVAMEGVGYMSDAGALSISLGNIPQLEELSKFSWVNVRGRTVHFGRVMNEGDTEEHTSNYGTWSFFEYGTPHHISPIEAGDKRPYYLNPDEEHSHRTPEMTKSYPAFRMFRGYDRAIFRNAVRDAIRSVEF